MMERGIISMMAAKLNGKNRFHVRAIKWS